MKKRREQRLILDAVMLGVVGALAAQLFALLLHLAESLFLQGIGGYTPPGLPDEGGVLRQVIGPHGPHQRGGLGVGLMALWLPQVLGGGYGWIQEAMETAGWPCVCWRSSSLPRPWPSV